MLADIIEPTIRAVADMIVRTGAPISDAWAGYTDQEDLIPLEQTADDNIHFIRANDHSARVEVFNIHPVDPDPDTLVFRPPVVKRSANKVTADITVENLNGLTPQTYVFRKEFRVGENEEAAVKAGFSVTSTTTLGTGDASAYKFSQEFSATVSSEWSKQTGRSKDETTGGEFPLTALPFTNVKGFLTWEDQDMLMHISCIGSYGFGVKIGRRKKSKRKGWRWHSGYHQWDTLDSLIVTAQGRGSVNFPLFHHWSRTPVPGWLLLPLQNGPRVPIENYIAYKGAANIRVVIKTLEDARPDDD